MMGLRMGIVSKMGCRSFRATGASIFALAALTLMYVQPAIAESVGANIIEGPAPERLGPYDITVDASLNPQALQCALRSVRPEGICTSVSIYTTPSTPVPLRDMYSAGVTFKTGRINSRPNLPKVLEMVLEGKFNPEAITTRTASWEDAPEALLDPSAKIIIYRD